MAIVNGTFNQTIKAAKTFGGARVVFEGHPSLDVGGYNFKLADLPAPGDVLPCGTPVYCDEVNRTITPVITGKVKSVSGTTVTLENNGFGGNAFIVGSTVAELGANLSTAASNYATIVSKDGDVLTLSDAVTGLAAGDILVEVDATSKKVKGVPNRLTPYDIARDANATAVDGEGMYDSDRPVLERRMPPINDAIKTALSAGGCKFVFSNRK